MARVSGSRRPEGIHFKIALPGSALCAVAFFLLVSLSGVICMPRGHPVQIPELASIPSLDEWTISEIAEMLANTEPQDREKKLATILERMQQMMQQQQQQDEAMEAAAEEGAALARMAMPPPLVQGRTAIDDDSNGDDDGKGKRGEKSFMSLCHFKICNMGRKRNMRYNPWNRV